MTLTDAVRVLPGWALFARYARAPNALGYCGPPAGLGPSEAEVRVAARRFSGAWPYLQVLARLTGTADPLDRRLVAAYWRGDDLGVEREAFGVALLAVIGPQAGAHWTHLTPALLAEAAPDHGFHVFGVYPWTRLLGPARAAGPGPLDVLDGCRIRGGTVLRRTGESATVVARRLTWDGATLGLADPGEERVGVGAGLDPEPGEPVALHWDGVCDRLTPAQVADLEVGTAERLTLTNARLARERA